MHFDGSEADDVYFGNTHYSDVIMNTMAAHITSITSVYLTVYKGADHRKHHWPLCGEFTSDRWISPQKWPATGKIIPFDDVIMYK